MSVPHLCNLVVPGAGKSGTSALHDILSGHPNINMSREKEPHYFSLDRKYAEGSQSHNALFDPEDSVSYYGESSTGYMISQKALLRIKRDLHAPKIIFLLRHPVDRCFSHYRWRFRLGLEKRSLASAVRESGYGYDPEQTYRFGYESYLQFSQYATYCPMWVETFGPENCLFISSEDLRADPDQSGRRICGFLGLPDLIPQDTVTANQTDALNRIPGTAENFLSGKVPKVLRQSNVLRKWWDSYLRATTPAVPASLAEADRDYLEHQLADDIEYYKAVTS